MVDERTPMPAIAPSGTQHVLRHGRLEAVVASIGATLRRLTHDGADLVITFAEDEIRPGFSGATLVPWPNRVVDGEYAFGGEEHRLALTEPGRGHALHGLAAWLEFAVVAQSSASVELEATIEPQQGYPWRIVVRTEFVLDDAGLTQRVRATNVSATPAPYGTGPHPYLVVGVPVDDAVLQLPAAEVLLVDARLAPTHLADVAADRARFDFRDGRRIGGAEIDHAFTSLARDGDGMATVSLRGPAGRGVQVRFGPECEWVQIHTADRPDDPEGSWHRSGLAVEPMTCAPDAFNRDRYGYETSLRVLSPGETAVAQWRIGPTD